MITRLLVLSALAATSLIAITATPQTDHAPATAQQGVAPAQPRVTPAPPATAPAHTATPYVVLLERGADPEFRPAAERLARLHGAPVEVFDRGDLDALQQRLRSLAPLHAAIVMSPQTIDVQFAQDLMERLVALDDDPFLDVRYAFITGRDGAAAERFVAAIEAARQRPPSNKAALFGSWEGAILPPKSPLSVLAAQGLDARADFVLVSDSAERRSARTREVLQTCSDLDLLLLFSHGYPDRMEMCFSGRDLREWTITLPPTVVVNCACWNGCPGRWWMPGPQGFTEQPAPALDDSVALAMLDTGIAAYVAGVDPWHGPLANQVTMHLVDGGLSLGDAAKAMIDRLALDFAPEPIRFGKVSERAMTGEGRDHRRRNAAGMIVYGDPAWAPFAKRATRALRASVQPGAEGTATRVTIECAPLMLGQPGDDFMLAQARLLDYHSPRSANVIQELKLEVVQVIDWPEPLPVQPELRVVSTTSDGKDIPVREVQTLIERDGDARRLHVRVPLDIRAYGTAQSFVPLIKGLRVELDVVPAAHRSPD